MSKLFDKLMEDENYRKLYEELPNDERPIMMDAMRKLSEDFEKKILIPLREMAFSGSLKFPEKQEKNS